MSDFCNLIQFSTYGDIGEECYPLDVIVNLCESGRAGMYVHTTENNYPQWAKLCALEEALVGSDMHEDFNFAVGKVKDDPEIRGWLEHGDTIIIPLGPKGQDTGTDVAVYHREVFDEMEYIVHAYAPASDDSAIFLNHQTRELYGTTISHTGDIG